MKTFIQFLRRESPEFRASLVGLAVFAGILNGLCVSIAIQTAKRMTPGQLQIRSFLLYAICIVLLWVTKGYVLNRTNRILEGIIRNLRVRIIEAIQSTSLLGFERLERGRIYAALSTDAITLSASAGTIINASAAVFMLLFVLVNLALLSGWVMLITIVSIGIAVLLYVRKSSELAHQLARSGTLENQLFGQLNGLMDGFKELKLDRAKSRDFFEHGLWRIIDETAHLRTTAGETMNQAALISQTFLLCTMAGVIFLLPNLDPSAISAVAPAVAMILFAAGPLSDVVGGVPALSRARAAIQNIEHLERELAAHRSDLEVFATRCSPLPETFVSLQCEVVSFSYPGTKGKGFALEPFDFSLKAGECVFVVGGNGSGKSTFLKLLTGLYAPDGGRILWNGLPVTADRLASYRELFTPIFSDFHIFHRILGADASSESRLRQLLTKMDLAGKIEVEDQQLVTSGLSTGQRKRLALALAQLNPHPIYVFDEWAADQDPVFRRIFYTEILPEMKAAGFAVVAVTHDDHYFRYADRVLKMEYGRFLPGDHHTRAFS